jgi:GST-like protein
VADLSSFPIAKRWPPAHPDRLQLYSLPTPNGVKVSIMLEEIGLPYEPHTINIGANETWTPEFLSLNPNGKIPAIIDPDGPGGRPFGLWESAAILVYLAEKTGKLLPGDPALRYETLQWVFFQMAAIGPMFGQLGFFHKFAGREWEDKRPRDRYATETKRLLGVLETRLAGREWIMGGRVHDCGYLDAGVGAQPRRLLRGGRPRRFWIVERGATLARARPCAAGRPAWTGDPETTVRLVPHSGMWEARQRE